MAPPDAMLATTFLYVVGVLLALLFTDARPGERVLLSLVWPLGPIAFVVTVAVLLAASVVAYPLVMVPAALAVAAVVLWALS